MPHCTAAREMEKSRAPSCTHFSTWAPSRQSQYFAAALGGGRAGFLHRPPAGRRQAPSWDHTRPSLHWFAARQWPDPHCAVLCCAVQARRPPSCCAQHSLLQYVYEQHSPPPAPPTSTAPLLRPLLTPPLPQCAASRAACCSGRRWSPHSNHPNPTLHSCSA